MNIWDLDKFLIFIIFVIPGFISLKTYELLTPQSEKDSTKQIVDAIAYSSINYAFLLIPINLVETNNIKSNYPEYYYIFYLFVFIFAPVIWVLIWKWLRKKDIFQQIAPHPTAKSWDFIFEQKKSYWIKITLIDGTIVGGKYSSNSFSSNAPADEQIYLEESWIINDEGGFDRIKNQTEGILIMQNRISHLEFIKY